jgi:DNA-binding CsgD family transcriptional regulator
LRVPATPEQTADAPGEVSHSGVALVGLSPVYAHGLRIGFTGAGLQCSTLSRVADLAPLLDADWLVVVLTPEDAAALAGMPPGRGRLEVVHVLTEGTVQAYANALRAGATSAFEDSAELDHVVRVVRSAALGRTLLPVRVARALGSRRTGGAPKLERHERQYLRRLADGGTVAGLARSAGWSEREMYRLLSGVYARLGASNRTEALLVAERWGLLDEEVL